LEEFEEYGDGRDGRDGGLRERVVVRGCEFEMARR
jgi:hypothetical protein